MADASHYSLTWCSLASRYLGAMRRGWLENGTRKHAGGGRLVSRVAQTDDLTREGTVQCDYNKALLREGFLFSYGHLYRVLGALDGLASIGYMGTILLERRFQNTLP